MMYHKLKHLSILAVIFTMTVSCEKEDPKPFYVGTSVVVSEFNTVINPNWAHDWQGPTIGTTPPLIDGSYLDFTGKPSATNPYITYLTIPAQYSDNGVPGETVFPLYVDPTKVYFNMYVYNPDSTASLGWLIVGFNETRTELSKIYTKQIVIKNPKWKGWKLLSFKYSEISAVDQYGNPIIPIPAGVPNKIETVAFTFLSTRTGITNPISLYVDKAIFSFNMPLVPIQ